ncbi:hypothetical protein [Limnohabitans sp.]|uniref:hypothetical protein n=1 Tax=Limnohabitans sp. TaxID=1907725 RepID=UPI00286ED780|nr:hypothetical protein [Limnohabitans sp.]
MRKLCLLLCISLFSSMFHAATMPLETGPTHTVDTVAAHEGHACEEASAPVFRTRVLQDIPNPQFMPPKAFSLNHSGGAHHQDWRVAHRHDRGHASPLALGYGVAATAQTPMMHNH